MTSLERWFTAVLVIMGVGAVPPAVAQHASGRPTRVPVTVALVNVLPADAPFRILRRPNADIGDVILLTAAGTADDLSSAVQELLLLRQLHGETGAMRARRPQGARMRSGTPGQRACSTISTRLRGSLFRA